MAGGSRTGAVPREGRAGRACRARQGLCPHRRPAGCHARHGDGNRKLGTPLCPDCFDDTGPVVWNATAPTLGKVTRDRLESAVTAAAGMTVAALRCEIRLTFVKATGMRARGLVHLHVVIRVDGRGEDPNNIVDPPAWATGT